MSTHAIERFLEYLITGVILGAILLPFMLLGKLWSLISQSD